MKTVGIIGGTGAMGKLFKKFFQGSGFKVLLAGRRTKLSPRELCSKSDLIIFSVPIPATVKTIREFAKFAKNGSVVSDFTSIKEEPLKAMMKFAPKNCEVVGMHPLFGPSIKSLKGQTIVLVKARGNKGFNFLNNFFKKQKAKVIVCTARQHDELMSFVQGLNHFDNLAFALTLADSKVSMSDFEKFATPNFKLKLALVSRVLRQNPGMYADLVFENRKAKGKVGDFSKNALKLKSIVERKDRKALERILGKISRKFSKRSAGLFEQSNSLLEGIK